MSPAAHFLALVLKCNEVYFYLEVLKSAGENMLSVVERIYFKSSRLFSKLSYVVRREGLLKGAFLAIIYVWNFMYTDKRYIVFRHSNSVPGPSCERKVGCDVRIIRNMTELTQVERECQKGSCLNCKYSKDRFRCGGILFCIVKDGHVVTYGWLGLGVDPGIDIMSKYCDYSSVNYIGDCYTRPSNRGRGLYQYLLLEMCEWLRGTQISAAVMTVEKNNGPSVTASLKTGFVEVGRVRVRRRMFFKHDLEFTGDIKGVWRGIHSRSESKGGHLTIL